MECILHVRSTWFNYCPFVFTLFFNFLNVLITNWSDLNVFNDIRYLIPLCWNYFFYSLSFLYSNLYYLLSGFSGELLFWDFTLSTFWASLSLDPHFRDSMSSSHLLSCSGRVYLLLVASREREDGTWISQTDQRSQKPNLFVKDFFVGLKPSTTVGNGKALTANWCFCI